MPSKKETASKINWDKNPVKNIWIKTGSRMLNDKELLKVLISESNKKFGITRTFLQTFREKSNVNKIS